MEEKKKLQPEEELYWKQYDRFVQQLRVELQQLYWLYNFFFLVSSGLLYFSVGWSRADPVPRWMFFFGLVIAVMWFWVFNRQRGLRDTWIKKVKNLDAHLEERYRMWGEKGGKSIASLMLVLPILFAAVWLLLLTFSFVE